MRTLIDHPRKWGLLFVSSLLLVGTVACGDDDGTSSTTSTVPMGSNIESLSYLMQGLLTTEQIGGGWVDQGRKVIPPGSEQLTGFLCDDGESAVAALAGRLDPQVTTSFERESDVGLTLFETLMWGDREQLTEDFESFITAVQGCDGTTYTTDELGEVRLDVEETPSLGTSAITFRFGPSTAPTDGPWLEQKTTTVLLSDPGEDVALTISIGVTTVHDPSDLKTSTVDDAELQRVLSRAIERLREGL